MATAIPLDRPILTLRRSLPAPLSLRATWTRVCLYACAAVIAWNLAGDLFVPLANFVVPFVFLRYFWRVSHGTKEAFAGRLPVYVWIWWGSWVAAFWLPTAASPSDEIVADVPWTLETSQLAGRTCMLVAALLCAHFIRDVGRAQFERMKVE